MLAIIQEMRSFRLLNSQSGDNVVQLRKTLVLLLMISGIILCAGCISRYPADDLKENYTAMETPGFTSPYSVTATSTLNHPPTTSGEPNSIPPSVSSGFLMLNEFFRYFSGENEIIVVVTRYDLVDRYEMQPEVFTDIYPHRMPPNIIKPAPIGKRFLFVYFTFHNIGKTRAEMPERWAFSVTREDGTVIYTDFSRFPVDALGRALFINDTYVAANANEGYLANNGLFPGLMHKREWYLPFTVPDTFDPETSYFSIVFTNSSSATWNLG